MPCPLSSPSLWPFLVFGVAGSMLGSTPAGAQEGGAASLPPLAQQVGAPEPPSDSEPMVEQPAFDPSRWNVVIVTADTLRGDMLSVNGNSQVWTPRLEELAQEGHNFSRAYTSITTTLPAHASLFSSLYPRDHRVWDNWHRIPGGITTIFEVLQEQGWTTAAHINMPWLTREVSNVPQGVELIRGGDHFRKARSTNRWVLNWLEQQQEREDPFFLWIHYIDNHTPYHAPEGYDKIYFPEGKSGEGTVPLAPLWPLFPPDHRASEKFHEWLDPVQSADWVVGAYLGSVSWVDRHVGEVMDQLCELGMWENTLFVFTADHGESLGEHDLWFVHGGLFEPTVHIPLIVRVPGGEGGLQHDEVVSIVDVMPTVLSLLELASPEGTRGQDLRPLMEGGVGASTRGAAVFEHIGRQLEGVVTDRYKYIRHRDTNRIYRGYPMREGTVELYDLHHDPYEEHNLAEQHPELVERMELIFGQMLERELDYGDAEAAELDEFTMEGLKALGYVQ
jgi:arylsulfatase